MSRPTRRALTRLLLDHVGDAPIVANLGSNTYDLYAEGDRPGNFYLWGGMGLTSSVGLGLAVAAPLQKVIVLEGDGSLLMGLGVLATIAAAAPRNLVVVVWDNEQWAETGGQPSHTARGTDLAGVARAAGIRRVETPQDGEELAGVLRRAMAEDGPWMIVVKVREEKPQVRPPVEPVLNKAAFMAHVRSLLR